MKLIITSKTNLFLILIATSVLFLGLPTDSFAHSHTTQSNALASYNNATNQISIDWDFNTLDPGTRCIMKGDFNFNNNINTATDNDINSFIPTFYSTLSTNPTIIAAIDQNSYAEEVDCSDSFKIDVDTILNHSTNVNDLIGFEAFITFYILNNDDNFSVDGSWIIDEVYVLYDPVNVVTQGTIDFACGTDPPNPQVGNVLYIDASGSNGSIAVHTNNAGNSLANCSEYIYTDSQQWVDISESGAISNGNHPVTFSLLFEVIVPEERKRGGGCSGDCTPPTFYKSKSNKLIVENGFSFNGNSTDVVNYHVPWDLITVNTNYPYLFSMKAFENNGAVNFKWVQIGFGIPEIGSPLSDAEVLLEVEMHGDSIASTNVVDDDNLVEFSDMDIDFVPCGYVDSDCLELSGLIVFREELRNNVIAINAIDNSRNSATHYINDGLIVQGTSMNPAKEQQTLSEIKSKGLQTLQRIDKINDIWVSLDEKEPVKLYQKNSFGTFIPIERRIFESIPDEIGNIMTRHHSEFGMIKLDEQRRAEISFDSEMIQAILGPSISYDYLDEVDRMDVLSELIDQEIRRAQIVLSENYTVE